MATTDPSKVRAGYPAWVSDRPSPTDAGLKAIADAALNLSSVIERAFGRGGPRPADRLIEMIVEWGACVEREHAAVTIYFGDPSESTEAMSVLELAVREFRENRQSAD